MKEIIEEKVKLAVAKLVKEKKLKTSIYLNFPLSEHVILNMEIWLVTLL